MFKVGDKVVCVEPGYTSLEEGEEYTVRELLADKGETFVLVRELGGFFLEWRFKKVVEHQEKQYQKDMDTLNRLEQKYPTKEVVLYSISGQKWGKKPEHGTRFKMTYDLVRGNIVGAPTVEKYIGE